MGRGRYKRLFGAATRGTPKRRGSMKERFRRIPIELIISPAYEDRTADARLVLLSLIVSPRQTPPGVYDGGMKSLEYETALPTKRLKAALKELEAARMVEPVSTGGWWVVDTFRAQCCNRDYSKAAIRHLTEKWPDILPKFTYANRAILNNTKYSPQTGDAPPSHPPRRSSDLPRPHTPRLRHRSEPRPDRGVSDR